MKYLFFSLFFLFSVQGRNRKIVTIDSEKKVEYGKRWIKLGDSPEDSIHKMIGILSKSLVGKDLVMSAKIRASKMGKSILEVISYGDGSLTDTTLVRKFSPHSPSHVSYESNSKVFINKNHNVVDGILDLAHELVHFTKRMPFNPYVNNYSLKQFIASTVEGVGGEVEAYLTECKVMFDLFPKLTEYKSNCFKILNDTRTSFSKEKGIKSFYRVGAYFRNMAHSLNRYKVKKEAFPYLSGEEAEFISSAYGLPYPIAAIEEYETIMKKACKNDAKRLEYFQSKFARGPASKGREIRQMGSSFERRCANFI